jgi:Rne/Rng family ribonuclease
LKSNGITPNARNIVTLNLKIRYALFKNGLLYDLIVERKKNVSLQATFIGRVTNILHNIQSAFINIGEGDNGFIHISDIIENTKNTKKCMEWISISKSMQKKRKQAKDSN